MAFPSVVSELNTMAKSTSQEQLTPRVDEIDHAPDRALAANIRLAAPTWKMPISMKSCGFKNGGAGL